MLLKNPQPAVDSMPQLSPRSAAQLQALIHRRGKKRRALTQDEVYELVSQYFDLFDTDHDGDVTLEDVNKMLMRMEHNHNRKSKDKIKVATDEAQHFFSKIDVNGNGRISKEEFYQFYKKI